MCALKIVRVTQNIFVCVTYKTIMVKNRKINYSS